MFFRVNRESVGDVNRCGDVGVGVRRDHASEQRRRKSGWQVGSVTHRPDVRAEVFAPILRSRGCSRCIALGLLGQVLGLLMKPGDLGCPEQQGLTAFSLSAFVAVDRHLDLRFERGEHLFRVVLPQRADDLLGHQLA